MSTTGASSNHSSMWPPRETTFLAHLSFWEIKFVKVLRVHCLLRPPLLLFFHLKELQWNQLGEDFFQDCLHTPFHLLHRSPHQNPHLAQDPVE